MSRLVVVTGGAGFIGSHVVDAFTALGDRVVVIDDLSSGRAEQVAAGATLLRADIRSDAAAAFLRDHPPELLVHLAAQMDVRKSVADPVFDADVNIGGTLNLLEAVRALARRPRVIFASTGGAIYGDAAPVPTAESAPCAPASPYGVAKLAVERYLGYYAQVHGLDAVALRFSNVFGPRQDPHGEAGVVAIFCDRLLDGRPLTVYGDGRQTRDYVFVLDVAGSVLRAAAAPPAPGTLSAFNIGTGRETDVMTLASTLAAAAGTTPRVEHAPARAGEQRRSALRIDAAAAALGWRPAMPLADGLARTLDWFAARRMGAAR